MYSTETDLLKVIDRLSAQSKVIRRATALAAGVPSSALTKLTREGKLRRVGRGLYQLADAEGYEHPDLVEVALQSPKGVIVLLSALSFHGVGTHPAREVWLQLPANYPAPRIAWPPVRVIRTRLEEAFTLGVETHEIAGHPVRITNLDRTIVDCFKHRSHVGLEVCLEALRERMRDRQDSLQNLHRYARAMRVARIMQPYLEVLA